MNEDPAARPEPQKPRRRSFLFEAARLASANFFTSFIQVLVGIATIRIWGVDARGDIEKVLALPGLLSIVFDLGLGRAMPYTIGRKLAPLQTVVSTTLIMWIVAAVIGAGICAGYAGVVYSVSSDWAHIPPVWVVLAIAYLPLRLFAGVILGFCVGVERMGFFAGLMWIRDPLALALLLGLAAVPALREPEHAWIRIATMDFGFLFTAALGLWLMSRFVRVTLAIDRKVLGEMTHRSVTFGLGPLFLDLLQNTPSMLLTVAIFAVPEGDIGNYTVGTAIAMLLMQLAYAVGHVLMSRGVNTDDHEAQSRKTLRLMRVGVLGATGLGLGMMATAPILVPLVYGPGTNKAPWITVMLVPGIVGFFALHTLSTDLIAKGRALVVARVAGAALAVNIATCSLFSIPMFGVWGAAGTTATCYVVAAAAMLIVYTRITGIGIRDAVTIRPDDLPIEQVLGRFRR